MSASEGRTSGSENTHSGGAIAWMARNPIAANLLMIVLLVGGIWSAFNVQKEVFPQFQLDIVNISVGYPGAAPEEVEQGILRPSRRPSAAWMASARSPAMRAKGAAVSRSSSSPAPTG
jgi:Cu/Ag efflux pump CusA